MSGLIANGTDVGVYTDTVSPADFYDYQEESEHQAQGLESRGITTLNDITSYILAYQDTSSGDWALFLHHYDDSGSSTQHQSQVVFNGFNQGVTRSGFVNVQGEGIDLTDHGDTSYVYASGTPVRNAGGGSFVYESGSSITPASAYTVVQDEVEDESAGSGQSDDKYEVNSNDDPVTKHLYDASRGDGAGYAMADGVTFTVTLEMQLLDDGRDDGQPVPNQWAAVGPNGTVTEACSVGSTFSVDIDTS